MVGMECSSGMFGINRSMSVDGSIRVMPRDGMLCISYEIKYIFHAIVFLSND